MTTLKRRTKLKNDEDFIRELEYQLVVSRDILYTIAGTWGSLLQRVGLRTVKGGLVHTAEQLLARPFPIRPKTRRS